MVVAAARAVPDQIVTAVLGFEELGENGRHEAGVVELHRKVRPVVLGVLFPGCADFDFADEDPVGGALPLVFSSATILTDLA
jgi:hypothetical protein